jgi:hypothetical protein
MDGRIEDAPAVMRDVVSIRTNAGNVRIVLPAEAPRTGLITWWRQFAGRP